MEKKTLVAYFSCSGVTKGVAARLADAIGADLYEIAPENAYTNADLNWNNPKSRSSVEMGDPSARPAIGGQPIDINVYDTVFVGFPIWWYIAPKIINTFLESHDFAQKTVVPFATSGGSGLGKTEENLQESAASTTNWKRGKLLNGRINEEELRTWVNDLAL